MPQASEDRYDVILDCGQPEKDRLTMLRNIQQGDHPTQVIVVTDEGGEEEARRAMEEGASDYVIRTEAYLTTLPLVVKKAHQRCRLLAELQPQGSKPVPARPLPPQNETTAATELHSDSSEALKDALTRMQRALEEVNALLEKSQIRFDNQSSNLEQAVVEARRQARDMSTLNAIADATSRSSVLDQILSNALDRVLEATGARMGAVLILDEEAKKILIASQRGLSKEFAQTIADVKTRGRTFLWTILSGNALLVDGISSGSDSYGLSEAMKKEGIGSLLGVPLSSKGKVRGAMIIAADEEGHLTSHDVDFLTIVGRQTGLAVENIQLREGIWRAAEDWLGEIEKIAEVDETDVKPVIDEIGDLSTLRQAWDDANSEHCPEHLTEATLEIKDEVQRQNRELWTINAIAEAVSQSFDLDEILSNVVSKLTAVMGIEASWVYLVEEQGKKEPELRLKAHRGVSERFAQGMTRVRMGEGPNGQVAISGEPLLIEDLVESNLRTKLVMEQEGLRSFAQVPMKAKDRVIGVIAVASHIPRPFAPHEVRLLTSISNQVGIAVEKVQLYHQVREYAKQQEKSNQVLQEINSMLMESQAELEAQMAAVKKAEIEIQQRNRELSALNAIVSHELRTPLASIIGYLDLMLDEETGPLNEEQSEYLSIIELNATRLNHLINDILDISRIEAGRIDLAMVPLDVIEIAKETMVTMQPQAQAKGIKMTISVAEGPAPSKACSEPRRKARPEQGRRVKGLPLIRGDPDRMRQVLVNVLGNAIKFTPQGGQVEISGQCLTAGEQPPPPGPELATTSDWLLVSVTDTGMGIAAEELDRVFEKFYQIEGTADRSSESSGLGLSIAQGIVEAHGGLIWAQSAGENQGSTFTFALPVPALSKAEGSRSQAQ
jgi:signal transduction histidine kinase/CheY-like chemotaxis protein